MGGHKTKNTPLQKRKGEAASLGGKVKKERGEKRNGPTLLQAWVEKKKSLVKKEEKKEGKSIK